MESRNLVEGGRNKFLYFLKGIGCMAIVFVHVPFLGIAGEVITAISAFSLPVFVLISGYYSFGCSTSVIKQRTIKIVKIFFYGYFWVLASNVLLHLHSGTLAEWLHYNFTIKALAKCVIFCTIDYAIPLWYLIAMAETYLLWYFVVKHKKEGLLLKFLPALFVVQLIYLTIRVSMQYPWFWETNFITKALPWFLFGYYIHSPAGMEWIQRTKDCVFAIAALAGNMIAVVSNVSNTRVNLFWVGVSVCAISLFSIGVKHPDRLPSRLIGYIGSALSLNIYIFHQLIASTITILYRNMFHVDVDGAVFPWLRPIITLAASVMLAWIIHQFTAFIKRRQRAVA